MDDPTQGAADAFAITNLVNESQFLIDTGRWKELTESIFVQEEEGLIPEADFGFAVWRGADELRAGFDEALPRFTAAVHAVTNMHITLDERRATARYYIHGWHWFVPESAVEGEPPPEQGERNADFMVLGVMTDELVRQHGQWRVLRRRLRRFGPGMAVGAVQPWLAGLGGSGVS